MRVMLLAAFLVIFITPYTAYADTAPATKPAQLSTYEEIEETRIGFQKRGRDLETRTHCVGFWLTISRIELEIMSFSFHRVELVSARTVLPLRSNYVAYKIRQIEDLKAELQKIEADRATLEMDVAKQLDRYFQELEEKKFEVWPHIQPEREIP